MSNFAYLFLSCSWHLNIGYKVIRKISKGLKFHKYISGAPKEHFGKVLFQPNSEWKNIKNRHVYISVFPLYNENNVSSYEVKHFTNNTI